MAKSNRFLPPVDDADPARESVDSDQAPTGGDPGEEYEIDSYSGSHMADLLQGPSGAYRETMGAGDWAKTPTDGDLDLDYDALPERMRRRPRGIDRSAPAVPLSSLDAPSREPGAAGGSKSPIAASHRRPSWRGRSSVMAVVVAKPRRSVLVMALLFIALGAGSIAWKVLSKRAAKEELLAPARALEEQREALYGRLAALVEAGRAVDDGYCPPLGDATQDVKFSFTGSGPASFPTQHRAGYEMARYEAIENGHMTREQLEDSLAELSRLGPAVVHVNVLDWRPPRLERARRADEGSYNAIIQGYVIGDAYVGNADTESLVCSFRFFASSSTQVRYSRGAQADLEADLLQRTYEAISRALRGVHATPGISGGRYASALPPTGF